MRRLHFAILWVALFGGCATTANRDARLRDDLVRRASFDLHCDASALALTELSRFNADIGTGEVSSYGVRGCEQEAVYVLSSHGVWVRNTDDQKAR
jgi:hypothetical protein